jgi:chemotaxis protein methyltransferase CheR
VATVLERLGTLERSFLLGSDVLEENLELARKGVYGELTVPAHVRARARWERRDLIRDGPPPGKWKLVLCRNVAIYLTPAAKEELQELLARSLAREGILMLGRSERITAPGRLGLEQAASHAYRKVE